VQGQGQGPEPATDTLNCSIDSRITTNDADAGAWASDSITTGAWKNLIITIEPTIVDIAALTLNFKTLDSVPQKAYSNSQETPFTKDLPN